MLSVSPCRGGFLYTFKYLICFVLAMSETSRGRVVGCLFEGSPRSVRGVVEETGLTRASVGMVLYRLWKAGRVLRTAEAFCEREKVFRGRSGSSSHTRPYHLYLLAPGGVDELTVDGRRFVAYAEEHLDPRGGGGVSKAQRVLGYLEEHSGEAFFSREVAEALEGQGVKPGDIMANVRRYERKGLVYVRGYKNADRQTPFREGYLLTWLDQDVPREEAIREAVERTDEALEGRASGSPSMMAAALASAALAPRLRRLMTCLSSSSR